MRHCYLFTGGPWFIAEGVTNMAMMPVTYIWLSAAAATTPQSWLAVWFLPYPRQAAV